MGTEGGWQGSGLPHNLLHQGTVESMEHAIRLVIAMCDFEIVTAQRHGVGGDPGGPIWEYREAAQRCQRELLEARQCVFARWAGSTDEDVRQIGLAALSGDFKALAI